MIFKLKQYKQYVKCIHVHKYPNTLKFNTFTTIRVPAYVVLVNMNFLKLNHVYIQGSS